MNQSVQNVSVGVDELLKKLQQEGVKQGKTEADEIVTKAKLEAEKIISQATEEANTLLTKAKKEADFVKNAGKESLDMAARNTILEVQSYLIEQFAEKMHDIITCQMKDDTLLQKIILEIAGRSGLSTEKNIQVILPEDAIDIELLRSHPEQLKNDSLTGFVAGQAYDLLKEGITVVVNKQQKTGIKFCLKDKDIQITLY
ncbi:MAG: hypothetical protein OXD32_02375 [Endozoicomonadaceae bacterium]|nr:hypothetical protein [Endozoicomonadaceae bacterium]